MLACSCHLTVDRQSTLIISRWVTLNSFASSLIRVAMTAFREWLCRTAPAPLNSYACTELCFSCRGRYDMSTWSMLDVCMFVMSLHKGRHSIAPT